VEHSIFCGQQPVGANREASPPAPHAPDEPHRLLWSFVPPQQWILRRRAVQIDSLAFTTTTLGHDSRFAHACIHPEWMSCKISPTHALSRSLSDRFPVPRFYERAAQTLVLCPRISCHMRGNDKTQLCSTGGSRSEALNASGSRSEKRNYEKDHVFREPQRHQVVRSCEHASGFCLGRFCSVPAVLSQGRSRVGLFPLRRQRWHVRCKS